MHDSSGKLKLFWGAKNILAVVCYSVIFFLAIVCFGVVVFAAEFLPDFFFAVDFFSKYHGTPGKEPAVTAVRHDGSLTVFHCATLRLHNISGAALDALLVAKR